jgi:glycosyltransferase involved in cell wall biosynthesis
MPQNTETERVESVATVRRSGDAAVSGTALAYLVSHPIQYQAPLLRLISAQPDIDLTVFFRSDISIRRFHDVGFGRAIEWDVPLLDGYRHEFLCPESGNGFVDGRKSFLRGLAGHLWSGHFDVLWIHGFTGWQNILALMIARLASVPVLVRDEATAISRHRHPIKASLKRLFFWTLSRMCGGFLAIGTLNRDYYLQNGIDPARVFMVPYAVDNAYFAKLADLATPGRSQLRAELGLEEGRPVILFASKFEPRKRAEDLLAAFEVLLSRERKHPKPYLLFIGDGVQRAELEARAKPLGDDVRFLGFRNQSELPAFFDLCDVFVLPSVSEPWGLVVNEVMSVGRPIIVSDQVGCAPDLVKDGFNGYVFPAGDRIALADALAEVSDNPALIGSMGRASKDMIARWSFAEDLDGIRMAIKAVSAGRRTRTRSSAC